MTVNRKDSHRRSRVPQPYYVKQRDFRLQLKSISTLCFIYTDPQKVFDQAVELGWRLELCTLMFAKSSPPAVSHRQLPMHCYPAISVSKSLKVFSDQASSSNTIWLTLKTCFLSFRGWLLNRGGEDLANTTVHCWKTHDDHSR